MSWLKKRIVESEEKEKDKYIYYGLNKIIRFNKKTNLFEYVFDAWYSSNNDNFKDVTYMLNRYYPYRYTNDVSSFFLFLFNEQIPEVTAKLIIKQYKEQSKKAEEENDKKDKIEKENVKKLEKYYRSLK
jgi:hypothetical protein